MLNNAADGFLFEMHLPNMTKDTVSLCERLRIVRSGFTNLTRLFLRLSGRLKDVLVYGDTYEASVIYDVTVFLPYGGKYGLPTRYGDPPPAESKYRECSLFLCRHSDSEEWACLGRNRGLRKDQVCYSTVACITP